MEDADIDTVLQKTGEGTFRELATSCTTCVRLLEVDAPLTTLVSETVTTPTGLVEEHAHCSLALEVPWYHIIKGVRLVMGGSHPSTCNLPLDGQVSSIEGAWCSLGGAVRNLPFERRIVSGGVTNWSHDLSRPFHIEIDYKAGIYERIPGGNCARCYIVREVNNQIRDTSSAEVVIGHGRPRDVSRGVVSIDVGLNRLLSHATLQVTSDYNQPSWEWEFDLFTEAQQRRTGRWLSADLQVQTIRDRRVFTATVRNWSHNNSRRAKIKLLYREGTYSTP